MLPRLQDLSEKEKQELADKWTKAGQSEHASVASFALFSQKLLCVGAPPDFVSESHECAMEEVEHAKLSFALASAYSGRSVEPATYESHTMTVVPDLMSLVEGLIKEGCVQETLSAFSAARKGAVEKDPAVKYVYSRITGDEAHHAAFAWKVVVWILKRSESNDFNTSKRVRAILESIVSLPQLTSKESQFLSLDEGNNEKEDLQTLCDLRDILLTSVNEPKEKAQEARAQYVRRMEDRKTEDPANEVTLRILENVL